MEDDLQYQQQIQENTQGTVDSIVTDDQSFDSMEKMYSPSGGQDDSFDKMAAQYGGQDMQQPSAAKPEARGIFQTVFDNLAGVPKQLIGGFWDAARNTSDVAASLYLNAAITGAKALGASEKEVQTAEDVKKKGKPSAVTPSVPESENLLPQMARPIAQFMAPFALAKAALVPQAGSAVASILSSGGASGIAGFLGFKGDEGRLSDLFKHFGIKTSLTDYLATDKNDSEVEARFKTGLETAGLGMFADGIVGAVKWTKQKIKAETVFKAATQQSKEMLAQGGKATEQIGKLTDVAPDKAGNLGAVPMSASEPSKSATQKEIAKTLSQTENLEGLTGNPNLPTEVAEAAYRKTPEWQELQKQLFDAQLGSLTREQILSGEALQQIKDAGQTSKLFKASQIQADFVINTAMPNIKLNLQRIAAGDISAWDDLGESAIQILELDNATKNLFRSGSQAMALRSDPKTAVGQAVNIANSLRDALKNADQMTKEKMTKVLAQTVLDGAANVGQFAEKLKIKIAAGKRIEKVLQEVYVNGLLSNPLATGFRDMMSTFLFNGIMVPSSKFFAGVLSPLRRALWKKASDGMDQVYIREGAIYLQSYLNTSLNAVRWMAKTMHSYNPYESKGILSDTFSEIKGVPAYVKNAKEIGGQVWSQFRSLRDKSQTRFDASRGVRAISAETFGVERNTKLGRTLDFVGNAVSLPSEGMMAKDDIVKSLVYRSEIETRAYRRAMTEGLEGEAFHKRVQQLTDVGFADIDWENASLAKSTLLKMGVELEKESDYQVFKNIVDRSIAQARVDTFTNQLGAKGEAVAKFIQNIPYGWTVVPFQKTPGNILHQTFVYSPVAPLLRDVRQQIAAGGAEADMALGRIATGSSIMSIGWALAYNGLMSGKLPKNKTEANMMQSVGFMQNSALIDGTYYSLDRFEPFSTILTAPASILQIARDADTPFSAKDEAAAQDAMTLSILGVSEMLLDKTYTMNLVQFMTMVAEQNKNAANRFMGSTVSSFVPFSAAARAIVNKVNPYVQQIDSIVDKLCADYTPSGSRPKLDPFGEPIKRRPTILSMEPYSDISDSRSAKIMVEALRVGAEIRQPDRILKGVKLNPDQYQKLMGYVRTQNPVEKMEAVMQAPQYQSAKETYSSMSLGEEMLSQMDLPTRIISGDARLTKAGRLQLKYSEIVTNAENKLLKEDSDLAKRVQLHQREMANTPKVSPTAKEFLNATKKVPTFSPR